MIIFRCIVFGAVFGVLHGLLGIEASWAVVVAVLAVGAMG